MKHNSCFQSPKGIVKTFGNKFYYFTKFIYLSDGERKAREKVFIFFVCVRQERFRSGRMVSVEKLMSQKFNIGKTFDEA